MGNVINIVSHMTHEFGDRTSSNTIEHQTHLNNVRNKINNEITREIYRDNDNLILKIVSVIE